MLLARLGNDFVSKFVNNVTQFRPTVLTVFNNSGHIHVYLCRCSVRIYDCACLAGDLSEARRGTCIKLCLSPKGLCLTKSIYVRCRVFLLAISHIICKARKKKFKKWRQKTLPSFISLFPKISHNFFFLSHFFYSSLGKSKQNSTPVAMEDGGRSAAEIRQWLLTLDDDDPEYDDVCQRERGIFIDVYGHDYEARAFLCLFPFGTGTFTQERRVNMRFCEYAKSKLNLSHDTYRKDAQYKMWLGEAEKTVFNALVSELEEDENSYLEMIDGIRRAVTDPEWVAAGTFSAEELSQRQAWAKGLVPPDMYEWFSNCYTMRCDDDYVWGGGNLHGPYNPDGDSLSIKGDFMAFCLLGAQNSVVPVGWDWPAFLKVAANFVCYAFEKSDAQERWGGENVFAVQMGGRSLRFTAEHVYGTGCMDQNKSKAETLACVACHRDHIPDAIFDKIGGRDAWAQFLVNLTAKMSGVPPPPPEQGGSKAAPVAGGGAAASPVSSKSPAPATAAPLSEMASWQVKPATLYPNQD